MKECWEQRWNAILSFSEGCIRAAQPGSEESGLFVGDCCSTPEIHREKPLGKPRHKQVGRGWRCCCSWPGAPAVPAQGPLRCGSCCCQSWAGLRDSEWTRGTAKAVGGCSDVHTWASASTELQPRSYPRGKCWGKAPFQPSFPHHCEVTKIKGEQAEPDLFSFGRSPMPWAVRGPEKL